MVARDHLGTVLELKAAQLLTDISELAEAYGVLQGLILAKEKGWTKVLLELDARNIILQIQSHDTPSTRWLSAGVFEDI